MSRKQISLFLEVEQLERVRQLSKRTGVPVQEYIRRGLAKLLDEQPKDAPETSVKEIYAAAST